MSLPELRLEFEDILRRRYPKQPQDFSRDSQGMYKNKRIYNMWEFMQLQHQVTYMKKEDSVRASEEGKYVIGRIVDGEFVFSKTPYIHRHRMFAFKEANRLTEKHNAAYGIFRCVAVTTPTTPELTLPPAVLETVQNWLP